MDAREVITRTLVEKFIIDGGSWSNGYETGYKIADAILAALAANQLAVVPREPSDRVINAGFDEANNEVRPFVIAEIWRAMFDAISPSPLPTGSDRR